MFTAACAAALLMMTPVQDAPRAQPTEAVQPPMPASLVPRRVRLLPEGSELVDVRGTIGRHASLPYWVLEIDDPRSIARDVELFMLPNRRLEEMELVLRTARDNEIVTFEVTGEVLAYGSRNYLLATSAPQLVMRTAAPEPTTAPEPATTAPDDGEARSDDSIESIMRDLDEAVGAIPRASDRSDDMMDAAESQTTPIDDGTLLVHRRGHVVRDVRGGWRFVFDADAHGASDPSVTLLPCLQLERIQATLTKRGRSTPMLVSGQVYTYRNSRYMLPMTFQVPRERTRLGGVNDQSDR
ncbi:MAG: hypothetical protein AAF432_03685 [Planctomycetota bacterium]